MPFSVDMMGSDVINFKELSIASSENSFIVDNKLIWKPDGYKTWKWRDHNINYVDVGGDDSKPPLLLIHGLGASVYHWRYNIPALSADYHVYALDLIGFGLSDKPLISYDASVWKDQVLAFIDEVIHSSSYRQEKIPCTVIGNSLGGFSALYASASDDSNNIKACVLLNAAGRYKKFSPPRDDDTTPGVLSMLSGIFRRFIINLSFIYTKQPQRIEQVLRQVYPVTDQNVDSELVESIQIPAQHPNAAEVFYRIITRNGNGPSVYMDDLLDNVKVPLLLLWGSKDPWIGPSAADTIQEIFPNARRVDLNAGHCAHDEVPDEVNRELKLFLDEIYN